jgi:hypothetical protein
MNPQDLIKLEFHLFDPSCVDTETTNGISQLARIHGADHLKVLLTKFFENLSVEWLSQPRHKDDLYRGALLAIQDVERVLEDAHGLAIVRDTQEKAKGVEPKKWRAV